MMSANLSSLEEIFHAALGREEDERAAFLDARCGGNRALRCEVEELLRLHGEAGGFIEKPIMDGAARLFEEQEQIDALIGEKIGPYEILRRISSGGIGAVYLAERAYEHYRKHVAIKLIKRGMDTEAVLARFLNERQILAGFDHPNIARLHDGGATEEGLPYFVMEHVEGIPIDDYCDEHKLSLQERLELFLQVCAAVSYAHSHAVIHRDLKPSNILVTSEGVPKLLDFGIAKILKPGDNAEVLATMTGFRLMTPEYASPEQVRGDPVTTASDVYSLGVVLYKLLTGTSPYRLTTRSPQEIEQAITEQQPVRPSTAISSHPNQKSAISHQRSLKGDLDNILLMALRKEAARRYQSVEQFSDDIRRHLESRPVLARRDTVAYRASKFIRRNKLAMAGGLLLFFSLVSGIIATAWQAHRARVQETSAHAEKARAERRFNEVRKLANSVLFDYHDAIKDLAGATPVRERLVKDALTYLDSLAAESAGDPALQRELAAAYERVGDVRGQAYSASLGDGAGAMESYMNALRIRQALVRANPRDVPARRDLANSYRRIGNQLADTSAARRGLDFFRKALVVCRALAAEEPANLDIRHDLANIYNDLGLALETWSDTSGALENHRQAQALREQLLVANPGNPTARRDLSLSYVNAGRALYLSGDVRGALESNLKGLALRAGLCQENPNNSEYRHLLAIAHQNEGDYRAFLGDIVGALDSFRKKLALDEEALGADPLNAQPNGDFGYSCERMGDLLGKAGDYSQAISFYRKAQAVKQKMGANDPQHDIGNRYHILLVRAGIATMQAKLGEIAAALAECRNSLEVLNAIPDDRTNATHGSLRAQVYMRLAETYQALAALGKIGNEKAQEYGRAAREMYRQSLDIWQDQKARRLLTGEDASRPDEVAREIAKCDAALAK